jgi:uncharacterized protein with PIN domain
MVPDCGTIANSTRGDPRPDPCFACDAMLGGLARWLRAAGYDATWREGIQDRELIRRAKRENRIVLSSDDDIFAFAVVRDGILPALFVPRQLRLHDQVAFVLKTLALPLRNPRCMACGGTLVELAKEAAAERVPPRTLRWLDRYWECQVCRKLFWRGTHWQRIEQRLHQAGAAIPSDSDVRGPR